MRTDLPFVVDAYDDCIADLDEQIGKLIDELRRRGVLERTWLVIASDHGESFGEHPGVFCHGTSLYQTELHVPLVIVPPGGTAEKRVVKETVSLRDLPATIVDLLDLEAGSPFPGTSLARYWDPARPAAPPTPAPSDPALAELVPGDARYRDGVRAAAEDLADGGPERRGVVLHPERGEGARGVVPPEHGPEGGAQPRPRSGVAAGPRADARHARRPDGRAARPESLQSVNRCAGPRVSG